MAETPDKPAEFVEALAKGIAILESFDANNPEMTLSEVSRRVGLSPAAARRSLITLEALGYIGRKDKRFHLRPKLMALGSAFYFSARIDEILQEDLREIVARFGDASSVGTLDGGEVIYVAHHSVQRARRAAAVAGARYPAYATSMGRVLLSALPDDRIDAYLASAQLTALTSRTCTDPVQLRQALLTARQDGYAITTDQLDYGITAMAVPIRDQDGTTVAALNTSGYTGIVTPETLIAERLPALQRAASHIAFQLTRYPTLRAVLGG
ncbi:MAG: helix-turn-helix domain-containing protein [Roseivivax sp.]|nr:helix-turn-helix domain-containing protein [Roseivivax sp.]